jgi:hypothetical protein
MNQLRLSKLKVESVMDEDLRGFCDEFWWCELVMVVEVVVGSLLGWWKWWRKLVRVVKSG